MNFVFFSIIFLFNALFALLFPFIAGFFVWRFFKNKETIQSVFQKFVIEYIFSKKQKYDVWIHGASVGEIKSAEFLIKKYIALDKKILVTTGTVTSRNVVENYRSSQVSHRFIPVDFLPFYLFFIYKHMARKVIILESELWPNLFAMLRLLQIETVMLNVDVSKRSQIKWQKFAFLLKEILVNCRLILTQNKSTESFAEEFHQNVKYLGNVKLLNLGDGYVAENENIINFCNSLKRILTVASTHDGEDDAIIKALKRLVGYKIIYVPRHPHRAGEISKMLDSYGIAHTTLSKYNSSFEFLLVDSIGNLMDALSFSQIAIYGGSFLPHLAGHNVLEAGIFKCKVVTGCYVEAFEEIIAEVKKQNGIIQTDANSIYEAILQAEKNDEMGQKIYEYILQNKPNLEKIFEEIGV